MLFFRFVDSDTDENLVCWRRSLTGCWSTGCYVIQPHYLRCLAWLRKRRSGRADLWHLSSIYYLQTFTDLSWARINRESHCIYTVGIAGLCSQLKQSKRSSSICRSRFA
ncbi:hypothetical protein BJX64DRAFT_141528 [Aspergillus heterothallicus]